MSTPPLMASIASRGPSTRIAMPQRAPLLARDAAAASFKVLRTTRVPQQLSLFERPHGGR